MPLSDVWHRDAYGLFNTPKQTFFTLLVNNSVQICAENADRVVLLIGCSNGATANIALGSVLTPTQGFVLNQNSPFIIITWEDHGPLVSQAWAAISNSGGVITVIEIIQERNPNQYGYPGMYTEPTEAPDGDQGEQPNLGVGGAVEYPGGGLFVSPQSPFPILPANQQDYYQIWRRRCAGRGRSDAVPGRAPGAPFGG